MQCATRTDYNTQTDDDDDDDDDVDDVDDGLK